MLPGSYTVIAIENGWDLDWGKPAVLTQYTKHGQTITVGSRASGAMQLPDPGRSATEVTCAPRTETKSAGQQRAQAGLLALWRQTRSLKEVVTALLERDHSDLRLTIRAVASSVSMPGDANA